jgi:hypothetical protein
VSKKELYLHIGLGKTGTTSLQNYFWANRKRLKQNGILYPELGIVAGAHHILSPHVPPFLKDVWNFLPVEDWAPKLLRMADRPVLLSSELISSAAPDVVGRFAEQILRFFDTKVIIYVRRQDHLIVAGYNQQVKAGTQLLDIASALRILFGRFDFKDRIEPWLNGFGRENLIVRPYERRQLLHGDIRRDFLEGVFGLQDTSRFQVANTNENPRFTYSALEYKRMINNVVRDTQTSTKFNEPLLAYSAAIDQNSTAIFHESDLLAGIERKMILDRSREVNSWIARELMGRPDGILFKDPEPEPDPDWQPPSASDRDFEDIAKLLKAQRYDRPLMGHIEQALKDNEFEAYRCAKRLAKSVGKNC